MGGPSIGGVASYPVEEGVAWVRLDRPQAKNALSLPMMDRLSAVLADLVKDAAVRVIVIGSTSDAFCAGADLKSLDGPVLEEDPAVLPRRVHMLLNEVRACPKPVIAAIGGVTIAGGLELALACDIRIASRQARIGDAHLKAGIIPGAGSSVALPKLIGAGPAKLLLYTGDLWTAERAFAAGLVDDLFDGDALDAHVQAIAARIASNTPRGIRITKRLVDETLTQSIAQGLATELAAVEDYSRSEDFKEAIHAFLEKRPARFQGV